MRGVGCHQLSSQRSQSHIWIRRLGDWCSCRYSTCREGPWDHVLRLIRRFGKDLCRSDNELQLCTARRSKQNQEEKNHPREKNLHQRCLLGNGRLHLLFWKILNLLYHYFLTTICPRSLSDLPRNYGNGKKSADRRGTHSAHQTNRSRKELHYPISLCTVCIQGCFLLSSSQWSGSTSWPRILHPRRSHQPWCLSWAGARSRTLAQPSFRARWRSRIRSLDGSYRPYL